MWEANLPTNHGGSDLLDFKDPNVYVSRNNRLLVKAQEQNNCDASCS